MADEIRLVAEAWQTAVYALVPVVLGLAGTIAAMAKRFMEERVKMGEQYAALNLELNHNLDRIGDYLKVIYNREVDEPLDRTEMDFKIGGKKEPR